MIDRDEERRVDLCEEREHLEAMEDQAGEVPPPGPRERPIIFSGPMVRAILDGTKTQTRRLVTAPGWSPHDLALRFVGIHPDSPHVHAFFGDEMRGAVCRYGQPGDRLWVRETLREGPGCAGWIYAADESPVLVDRAYEAQMLAWTHHKQGGICVSIHMPRWASRLARTVVAIRVERLQSISEADAVAEMGLAEIGLGVWTGLPGDMPDTRDPVAAFSRGWDTINGKRAPWESNPWVWVVTFAPIEAGS